MRAVEPDPELPEIRLVLLRYEEEGMPPVPRAETSEIKAELTCLITPIHSSTPRTLQDFHHALLSRIPKILCRARIRSLECRRDPARGLAGRAVGGYPDELYADGAYR
jgi:hypothetical protein